MHSTSAVYKELLADPMHRVETLVRVAGKSYVLDDAANETASIYGGVFQSPSVGGTAARQLDLSFFPRDTLPRMAKLTVSIRLRKGNQVSEEIPKGVFFVDTRETDEETGLMTIHAYDALLLLSSKTVSRDGYAEEGFADPTGWPRSAQSAMGVIARRIGVEIDSRTELDPNISVLYPGARATLKQVASWIAAAHGGNWTITDEGKLRLLPLSFGVDALSVLTDEDGNILDYDTSNDNKKINITLGALTAGENFIEMGLSEEQLHIYAPFSGWTEVVFKDTKGDAVAAYGTETGRIMEAVCPFGTAEMAQYLLEKINLDEYKPFEAVNAILDPAVELGDAVEVAGFMSVIYQHDMTLDRLCACNIAAPGENEIDHEFPPDANITQDIAIIQEEVLDPLIEGETQLPGESTAESLYQIGGDAANIIVDRLRTSRRIPNYLASDTSDDRFSDIRKSQYEIIAGIYNGGTEHATSPYGEALYWESNPADGTIGADGYPEKNGKKIHIVTKPTDWPVMVYTYTEQIKGGFSDKQVGQTQGGEPIYVPVLTLGAGNAAGNNIAHIYKDADGLTLTYLSNTGRGVGLKGTTDGFLDLYGLRRTDYIDFSNWKNGTFAEKIEGSEAEHSFGVEFDAEEKPVRIWDSEHSQTIVWGDHDPATEIFLAGIAIGKQLKGWSAVTDFSGQIVPEESWAVVNFTQWAIYNGREDVTQVTDDVTINSDNSLTWLATVDDLPEGTHVVMRDGSAHYGWMTDKYYNYSVVLRAETGWNYDGPVKEGEGRLTVTLNPDRRSWRVVYRMGSNTWYQLGLDCYYLTFPIDGTYVSLGYPAIRGSGNLANGDIVSLDKNYADTGAVRYAGSEYFYGTSVSVYDQTSAPEVTSSTTGPAFTNVVRASAVIDNYLPGFRVIPHSSSGIPMGARAGQIYGAYGTIQDGTPTKLHIGYVVNESEKTLYNPITNEVTTFDGWTYNYKFRRYVLDDTITVTFGDDEITINDGANTYTIKYLVRTS